MASEKMERSPWSRLPHQGFKYLSFITNQLRFLKGDFILESHRFMIPTKVDYSQEAGITIDKYDITNYWTLCNKDQVHLLDTLVILKECLETIGYEVIIILGNTDRSILNSEVSGIYINQKKE